MLLLQSHEPYLRTPVFVSSVVIKHNTQVLQLYLFELTVWMLHRYSPDALSNADINTDAIRCKTIHAPLNLIKPLLAPSSIPFNQVSSKPSS